MFDPFFTTKGTVGTGLGLWVCKQLVDKNGGSIRVRSTTDGPKHGTTFSVTLPRDPSPDPRRSHLSAPFSPSASPATPPSQPPRLA